VSKKLERTSGVDLILFWHGPIEGHEKKHRFDESDHSRYENISSEKRNANEQVAVPSFCLIIEIMTAIGFTDY
jgi:hypothetical protein